MSDGITAITMPKWGFAMTEGKVVEWHAEAGREVASGTDLLDIETTKITNVFEAPAGGTLRRITVSPGETVPVGALLGVIAPPSVSDADIDAFVAEFEEHFVPEEEGGIDAAAPQTVEVNGGRIRYIALGEGDATPVLFIHGFGGDLNSWQFNQPQIAASRRTVSFDLPGHGGSRKDVADGHVAALAKETAAFLAALGIARAHLVGHSLGGAVALQLALEHPALAASLTLIAPAGLGAEIDGDYISDFIAADRRRAMKEVAGKLFAHPAMITRDFVEELVRYKRIDGVAAALSAIAGANFAGSTQQNDLAPRLGELGVPVQVIWGEEDRIIPASQAQALPEDARHVIPGAGHMVQMEKAGEVNALIGNMVASA